MRNLGKIALMFFVVLSFSFGNINILAEEPVATISSELSDVEVSFLEELSELDPTHDNVDGEIVSVSKIRIRQDSLESDVPKENGSTITPFGVIGANYMTLYVTVTRQNDPGYDKFQLYSYFKWDTAPKITATDGIALAWSDSFTLISSSMTLYYKGSHFNGYNNNKAYLSGVAPEIGVGYSFPLSYAVMPTSRTNVSYGAIRATVRKNNSTGTANVVAKYVHSTINITGVSFGYNSSGPSISVSIGGSYDFKEAYTHWSY